MLLPIINAKVLTLEVLKMSNRPFGSRDWNNNGEYDLFDKVTDRYVFDQVTKKTERKTTQQTYTPPPQFVYQHSEEKPKKEEPPKRETGGRETTMSDIVIFFIIIFVLYFALKNLNGLFQ